jgi:hypothetical protein
MNTAVAMRTDFDATFPDFKSLAKGQDRVPGRPLGQLIVNGLRARGFQASDLEYEEPFFVTRCQSGEHIYPVFSYVLYPDKAGAPWMVCCEPQVGFWGKLFGKSEEKDIGSVVDAIHDTLKNDAHIRDIRWFKIAPYEPFSEKKYATSPRDES